MRYRLFLLLYFSPVFAFTQSLSFDGLKVDSLTIRAQVGAYQFDSLGMFVGYEDMISLTFDRVSQEYRFSSYIERRFKHFACCDSSAFDDKSMGISKANKNLNQEKVYHFMKALETPFDTNAVFGISETIECLPKSKIRKALRAKKNGWYWSVFYSKASEREAFYFSILDETNLFKYCEERHCSHARTITTDYGNEILLHVHTGDETYYFVGDYTTHWRLPWYTNYNAGNFDDISNHWFDYPQCNPNINLALAALLPKGFFLREDIEIEAFLPDYLDWLIEQEYSLDI